MFKRTFTILLAVLLTFSLFSCQREHDFVSIDYTVSLHAENAFVYRYHDQSTKKFFHDQNETVHPASITKLLTALTALEILPADTLITPGQEVYSISDGSSSAYIRPHHQLTLEMLIEGMLLPSGNDAAYAIAAACGQSILGKEVTHGEAVAAFVEEMNTYARSLGCTDSNFTVPDGLAGDEHYSTLDDMLCICLAAAENDIILKYASLSSDNVVYASGHTNTWVNTNEMLDPDSPYYNPNVIGLKTGSLTDNYSLVILYDDGNLRLLIGVFGAEDEESRYKDVAKLIEAEKSIWNP